MEVWVVPLVVVCFCLLLAFAWMLRMLLRSPAPWVRVYREALLGGQRSAISVSGEPAAVEVR